MLFQRVEESALNRRTLGQAVVREVAPLILSAPEVAPLGKDDRLTARRLHREGITSNDVDRKNSVRRTNPHIIGIGFKKPGESTRKINAALFRIVLEQLDPIHAHQGEETVVAPLEVTTPMARVHRVKLSLEHRDQEISRATGRYV